MIGSITGLAARAVRTGTDLTRTAAALTAAAVTLPVRLAESGIHSATEHFDTATDIGSQLRHDLGSLLDPTLHRDRRIASMGERVLVEVRGLTSDRGAEVATAVERRLRAVSGVRWSRVNAITGHVIAATEGDIEPEELVAAVEEVERQLGVTDVEWDPTASHPADLEPVLSAGISLIGDLAAMGLAAAGAMVPGRAPVQLFQAAAALVDTQPRLRTMLEEQVGRARADLLVTTANAIGQAAGESVANLAVDAGLRALVLAEAGARHVRWRQWEAELARARNPRVTEPMTAEPRPVELPPGPVERSADEAGLGSLLGTVATLTGRGPGDAASAIGLGAPKAARTSRESFAAVAGTLLSIAGVVTIDPELWRRLDRLDTLVLDGEVLLGRRRLVLDAEAVHHDWRTGQVWSTAQRLLWSTGVPESDAGQPDSFELVPEQSGRGTEPRWHRLSAESQVVGRVLVGRELDRRAQAVLVAARRAGLRVVLAGDSSTDELRSLVDEFVPAARSRRKLVRELQRDGKVVALLSTHAHRALAAADAGIGVVTTDQDGAVQVPWTADAVCADLDQVQRVLAAVTPARHASERGRVLALSACALGGLLLAATPKRHREQLPITAAQTAGLLTGVITGWQAAHAEPESPLSPLLPWHSLAPDEVLVRLPEPEPVTEPEAGPLDRLRTGAERTLTPLAHFASHVRQELADPLTPVLGVGAVASAILGAPSDAILVGSVISVNAVVSALQRQRAENALRQLIRGEAVTGRRVPRRTETVDPDAVEEQRVPADRLQVGDLIALRAGDVVPADARLIAVEDLELDESALTGESVTVEKRTAATPGAPLGERACMVFEGSTVVNGDALAVVVAVGRDTEAQRAAASAVPPPPGGVQAQLHRLTGQALPLTLAGGGAVTALGWLRGQRLRAALADGVAVATAAVPEGLPLVATIAQLAAARRLSRHGVLVRASRTVEALGRVDTICFDKTGTLTHGRLRLAALADLDERFSPDADSERAQHLLRAAARACPDPDGPVVHATDRAVLDAARDHLPPDERWDPLEELPFESNRGYAATLGRAARRLRLAVKGAPEVILDRCVRLRRNTGEPNDIPFTAAERERADQLVYDLAAAGLRVLVVARRDLKSAPADVEDAVEELTLLGFIGLADTPRPQAEPLITALRHNNIEARIITGDHPVTAAAVARQLGIDTATVTTGQDLDRLDESAQAELIERSAVFARVSPRHKVRIVATLQRAGHVVAMAGDGGNDAAAIRTADIGIGLAARGSAAARNAADLVLTDPDPLVLLSALAEGRGMWQRVSDAVGVLVGGNAGEVAFTALGTALSGQAPLGTRQFLLVNMLTDMFPAMAVALSSEQQPDDGRPDEDQHVRAERLAAELAARPPADLGADLLRTIALRGATTAAGATAAWTIGRYTGTRRRAETIGLVALIGTQLGQTLVAARHSPLVWATTAASGAVLVTVVMTPGLCTYFGCRPLGPVGWLVASGSAVAATGLGALRG
ncbi:cation-translocating P-type ATPase [Nocardia arthritidis]|uniref:HAD-IC family P-type ATPase n=1 Tax=Nocardia arthritidis TaxID=228602 RepID=A0A6G9YMT6_9NOCA|nr:cation-translocating P-type ATPase [Nocardia arthritidis]QIS14440.1 HAD-IC family P-type ATPase [Nocardia arthritidis]